MKKYMFLLAGLLLTMSIGDAEAKAVKLGRDVSTSMDRATNLAPVDRSSVTTSCPAKQRLSGDTCVPICNGVTCADGYRAKASDSSCCCVKQCSTGCSDCDSTGNTCYVCMDGFRLSNGKCMKNCTGITCKVGYKAKPAVKDGTGYCCCVSEEVPTCPAHCASCNTTTGTCGSCESGYTLKNGICEQNVTCPANCSTCNSSGVCTKCANNYILQNGSCVLPTCPAHCSSCNVNGVCTQCANGYKLTNGSCTQITCSAGYYNNNGTCTACTGMYYSLGGTATSCTACSTYTSSGSNTCTSCSNTTGECTGSNGGSSSGGSSSGGSSGCHTHSQCPSGYECTGGNGCQKCSSGSNLSYGNCNCPAGQYSTGNGSCSYAMM